MVYITYFALAAAFISPIGAEVHSGVRRGLTQDRESLLESIDELYNAVTSNVEAKFDSIDDTPIDTSIDVMPIDDIVEEIRNDLTNREYRALKNRLDQLEGRPRCVIGRVLAKVFQGYDRDTYNSYMKAASTEDRAALFEDLSEKAQAFRNKVQDEGGEDIEDRLPIVNKVITMLDELKEAALEGKAVTRCIKKTAITDDIKDTFASLNLQSSFEAPSDTNSDFEKLLHPDSDEDGI